MKPNTHQYKCCKNTALTGKFWVGDPGLVLNHTEWFNLFQALLAAGGKDVTVFTSAKHKLAILACGVDSNCFTITSSRKAVAVTTVTNLLAIMPVKTVPQAILKSEQGAVISLRSATIDTLNTGFIVGNHKIKPHEKTTNPSRN